MTYEIIKAKGNGYILIISREDGTQNDYRFDTKAQLNRWIKMTGIK